MTDPAADGAAVRTERHGRVLLVTINRPEARNAVNAAVATGLGDALERGRAPIPASGPSSSPAPATRRSAPGPT